MGQYEANLLTAAASFGTLCSTGGKLTLGVNLMMRKLQYFVVFSSANE